MFSINTLINISQFFTKYGQIGAKEALDLIKHHTFFDRLWKVLNHPTKYIQLKLKL